MCRGGSSFSERRATPIALLVVPLLVVAASAVGAGRTLVLANGRALAVSGAELHGTTVVVTLASGVRQAYASGDVDLAASGLKAGQSPAPPQTALDAGNPRRRLLGLDAADPPRGGFAITDADVGHVAPGGDEDASEAAAGRPPAEAAVTVSGIEHRWTGSGTLISGLITNTSATEVRDLTVEVAAFTADRRQLGSAERTLALPLAPGGSASFSVAVPLDQRPEAVRVFVTGPVARVLFDVDRGGA